MKFLGLIILLFGLCNAKVVEEYGSEDINNCDHEIILGEGQNSTFSFTNRHILKSWDGSSDVKCTFEVKSQDKIALVFQYFNLLKMAMDDNCDDYIQLRNANNETALKVCGVWSAWRVDRYEKLRTFITNPFLIPERYSKNYFVEIFLGKEILKAQNNFNFTISFTAWKSCDSDDLPHDYAPCGETGMCMWAGDGKIVNCPYQDCLNEPRKCGTGSPQTGGSNYSALIVGIIIYVLFICLCWFIDSLYNTPDNNSGDIPPQTQPRRHGFVYYRHRTNLDSSTRI